MRVFISWSGDRSRTIADILRRWFPSVLQAVRPYFSPDDVAKGSRSNSEIAKELEASRVGLLVLTPQNQDAPWLLFEAGALAKNLDRSKVCPILFGGLEATDVKGPLVQFQASRFEAEDMKRLVKMVNAELGDAALSADVFDSVFEMWWPKLASQVKAELDTNTTGRDETSRSDRDMLEEVLALTRTMARDVRARRQDLDHPVVEDLSLSVLKLIRLLGSKSIDEETSHAIRRVIRPLEFLAHRERSRGSSREARDLWIELDMILKGIEPRAVPESPGGVSA